MYVKLNTILTDLYEKNAHKTNDSKLIWKEDTFWQNVFSLLIEKTLLIDLISTILLRFGRKGGITFSHENATCTTFLYAWHETLDLSAWPTSHSGQTQSFPGSSPRPRHLMWKTRGHRSQQMRKPSLWHSQQK